MKTLAEARASPGNEIDVRRLAFVTIPATDIAASRAFYAQVLGVEDLGMDRFAGFGHHAVLRLPSRQLLVLAAPQGPDTRETGVHHGFRASAAARAAITARLAAANVEVVRYKEDRAAEEADNFYFHDRDGNRLQLVTSATAMPAESVDALDHTAVLVYDMLWAEAYYVRELKFEVESRVGLRTVDHSRAQRWKAGQEQMAPGTRRLDKPYILMGGQREIARANMQLYLKAGESVFGLYLATKHQQEPPEEQVVGSSRTAFLTGRTGLDRIAALLEKRKRPFEGPVEHPSSALYAASLYCKDLSGNFLEFCAAHG